MALRTALTNQLGIKVPVICAPMAGVGDADLAVAVSRAGALGMIGISGARSPEWVTEQLAHASAAQVPYGVGLMAWALPDNPEIFDLVIKATPALVSISLGTLEPWIGRARGAGIPVAVQVGSAAEARAAEKAGASLIVARGAEAGGHGRADIATLPLLQHVLDTVSVPVVAAGGITGARGLAAVLAAGAAGAWAGTAFIGCFEATHTPAVRQALATAAATDTIYTRAFDIAQRIPWPPEFGGRGLRNAFTDTWADREEDLTALLAGQQPDEGLTASIRQARIDADLEFAPIYCGQGVGQIRVEVSAADVVADFAKAEGLIRMMTDILR